MNAYIKNMLLPLCLAGSLLGLTGCEQDGPAERAGEKVDESMEKAGEKLEQAGETVKDSVN